MNIHRAIAIGAITFALGCSSHPSSNTPSRPSPVPQPPPAPRYQVLSGYASDTAFRPVAGATVTLVDGPQAGASTASNEAGRFTFAGTFEVGTTVRVSKEGYTSATATARPNGSSNGTVWAFVLLDALAKPVDLVGDYTLTIVADSACTGIPDDVRTRTYSASIGITPGSDTQSGTSLMLAARGASFVSIHDSFPIGVAGGDVAFTINAGEDFGLIEKIAPGTFLAIGGFARVSVGTGPIARIATPFSGSIDYCALQSDTAWTYQCNNRIDFQHCDSTQHQLILSRR
jgi:carboxypeptidase family protein